MVIGDNSSYDPGTKTYSGGDYTRSKTLGQPPHSSYKGSQPQYSGGIVGFNRVVVKMIHKARITNPPNVARLLQWSVFGFGSDLMHFDITHNPGQSTPPISEVNTCQTVVDAFGTQTDGANPWCPTGP
jgi:hypothetical protein